MGFIGFLLFMAVLIIVLGASVAGVGFIFGPYHHSAPHDPVRRSQRILPAKYRPPRQVRPITHISTATRIHKP